MAVAVRNNPEMTSVKTLDRLAVGSLAGVIFILLGIVILFPGLQSLWWDVLGLPKEIKFTSLLFVVRAAGVIGAAVLLVQLIGSHSAPGLKAGICVGFVEVVAIGLVTCGVGSILENAFPTIGATVGLGIMAAIAIALLVLAGVYFVKPVFQGWLVTVEEQGWFSIGSYKRQQGQRVRRGTIVGILILAGCGIYTLLLHKTLESGLNDWNLKIPFTDGRHVTLLPDVQFTLPLLLAALSLWLAYRVVNFPAFADFLIATEAELNKVSWTTRKRLVQDTIVVLTTVILLTTFLFVVDMAWAKILTQVGVLKIDTSDKQVNDQKEQSW